MLLPTIIILVILLFLIVLGKVIKIKKMVWQNLEVVYNQIYMFLIQKYYSLEYWRNLLKRELNDYLKNVILASSVNKKISYINSISKFLEEFLGTNYISMLDKLNTYEKNIISLDKVISFIILVVLTLIALLFYTLF